MKIHDISLADRTWLKITDLENMFNIYLDKKGNFVYNLNSSVYFNDQNAVLSTYTLTTDAHWPLVSYKIYGTTRLAWLLMKLNGVDATNVFKKLHASDKVKYIEKQNLERILDILNEDQT